MDYGQLIVSNKGAAYRPSHVKSYFNYYDPIDTQPKLSKVGCSADLCTRLRMVGMF